MISDVPISWARYYKIPLDKFVLVSLGKIVFENFILYDYYHFFNSAPMRKMVNAGTNLTEIYHFI